MAIPSKMVEKLLFLIGDEQLIAADDLLSLLEAHPDYPEVSAKLYEHRRRLSELRKEAADCRKAKKEFDEEDGWALVQVSA